MDMAQDHGKEGIPRPAPGNQPGGGSSAPDPRRIAAVAEAAPLAFYESSPSGNWTFAGRRFREILGLPPGESLEGGITRLIAPEDRDAVIAAWTAAVRAGTPFQSVFRVHLPGGAGSRWIRARGGPLPAAGGAAPGYGGVLEDATEERRREEALVHEAQREREASRRKSEFLAVMSHEIRTPLHGLVGTASLLQSTELTPEQREYCEMLTASADATLQVLNEILDLSRIEAGRMELQARDFDLRALAEQVVSLFAARAHAKGVEISALVPWDLPTALRGDDGRLRQVLLNLLGNAVKFTEKGAVSLRVARADEVEDPLLLRFEVRDSGPGISEAARAGIFEPYTQADAGVERRYGGTGLGLAIARRIVSLMGGAIGLEAPDGGGTLFWFTVPIARSAAPAAPRSPRWRFPGLRVLVVDRGADSRAVLRGILEGAGVRVDEAAEEAAGIAALRAAAAAGAPYGAVILDADLRSPAEGPDLAAVLRAEPALGGARLLLATALGWRGRVASERGAGVAGFLAKPARLAEVLDNLAEALDPSAPRAAAPGRATPAAGARVLVVDDNHVNRKIARRLLEKRALRVDTAADGKAAVDASLAVPYDLIFMDWMLPVMDGFEATRRIRERERGTGRRTPIVAMTARAMEGDRERCLEPGMDDYLAKPVRVEELDAVLDRWLPAGARDATAGAAGFAPAVVDLDPAPLDALASLQSEGDPDVVGELVGVFVEEAPGRLSGMRAAVEARDASALERAAHGLKGTAASLGAVRVAAVCRSIEEAARAGSVGTAPALLEALEPALAAAGVALRAWSESRRTPG
jgi:two-component system sensor histidine kinase/response regulator